MDSLLFNEIVERKRTKQPHDHFWPELAKEYGFSSPEALRSSYRRMRKNLGGATREEKAPQNIKILIFDIETAPMLCYTFDLWDQNIGVDQIVSDSFLISWSAKMLNESKIYSDVLTSEEAIAGNDYRIVKSIWELLNTCQILIGQNIRDFDLKKLNVRFLYYDIPPISRSQIIDTLVIAKQNFAFPSNSLKYLNNFLGIKQKIANEGFMLWRKCMQGDEKALKKMDKYCKGDIAATEDLYYRIRPFIKGHPNLALYFESNESRCPNCSGLDLKAEGIYFTPAGKWTSLRCNECGALSRSKQNLLSVEKRKTLKVN